MKRATPAVLQTTPLLVPLALMLTVPDVNLLLIGADESLVGFAVITLPSVALMGHQWTRLFRMCEYSLPL
jgi:hypothetical protein